jgi:hypothetical protein
MARDMIVSMQYKFHMFGVPIKGPAHVLCDNQGIVKNSSIPELVFSKKHNAINYHAVGEAVVPYAPRSKWHFDSIFLFLIAHSV